MCVAGETHYLYERGRDTPNYCVMTTPYEYRYIHLSAVIMQW